MASILFAPPHPQVVEMVGDFAKRTTCTCLAVIHQPRYEVLECFDQVVLMATGGYLAYAGSAEHMRAYFTEVLGVTSSGRKRAHCCSSRASMLMDMSRCRIPY